VWFEAILTMMLLLVDSCAVESNVRRQGIGQALVKMCEDLSVEWGHNVLFLHVEESNKAAIDFYATLGFSEATRDLSWCDPHFPESGTTIFLLSAKCLCALEVFRWGTDGTVLIGQVR